MNMEVSLDAAKKRFPENEHPDLQCYVERLDYNAAIKSASVQASLYQSQINQLRLDLSKAQIERDGALAELENFKKMLESSNEHG